MYLLMELLFDLGIIIIVAGILAIVFRLLNQPIIPAYVITGLLLGPVFGVIQNQEFLTTLSELGIAFMLFFIGLEIDIKAIKQVWHISIFGTLLQFFLTGIIGLIMISFLPYPLTTKIFISIALTFSSTAVVIKLLSDKNEIDTLHGKIAIGILLFQDIIAIIVLALLTPKLSLIDSLIRLNILVLIALIVGYKIIPTLFNINAKSQELLFLTSIAYAFFYILLFDWFKLSITVGAFIAGLTLGNLKYSNEIVARVKSLKDFFSIIFFISLGFQISRIHQLNYTILISFFILTIIIKPIILFFIGIMFKYEPKVSFKVAVSLSQMSEFALILTSLMYSEGFIGKDMLTYIVITTILTMILTDYLLKLSPKLYKKLPLEKWFKIKSFAENKPEKAPELLICGFNRLGYNIFLGLKDQFKSYLIVDYNPEIIAKLIEEGHYCIYGDASDPEVLNGLNLKHLKLAISTLHDLESNLSFLKTIKKINKNAKVFVTAYDIEDAIELYKSGADYVILPHFISGNYIGLMLKNQKEDFEVLKFNHFKELLRKKKWFESKGLHKILRFKF